MKIARQLFAMSVASLLVVLIVDKMPLESLACVGKIFMCALACIGSYILTNIDTLVRINKQVMEEEDKKVK